MCPSEFFAVPLCLLFSHQANAGAAFSEDVAVVAGIGAAAMGAQWFVARFFVFRSFCHIPVYFLVYVCPCADCVVWLIVTHRAMKDGLGEVGKLLVSKYCSHLFDWYLTSMHV
jgi:hypothetical protein